MDSSMKRPTTLVLLVSLLALQTVQITATTTTEISSGDFSPSTTPFSNITSFKTLTLNILPGKNYTNGSGTINHPPPSHNTATDIQSILKQQNITVDDSFWEEIKQRHIPMFQRPPDHPPRHKHHHRPRHFHCVPTVPRMNLRLDKILGTWYPVLFSKVTLNLWLHSLQKKYKTPAPLKTTKCFKLDYNTGKESTTNTKLSSINLAVHNGNQSMEVKGILIGDAEHPKGSKWAVAWPNGEDTLTSVVAAGVVGKDRGNQYSWLLTVDCDINGIVESDWAVMARLPGGLSAATLHAILAILEGLKGITVDHAIAYQSAEHCHK